MEKYNFCIIIYIILFNLIFSNNYSYLTFDLEIYAKDSFKNSTDFINSYLNSLYYTKITFGSSELKYIMQINLDDYGFKLTNYDCDIQTKDNTTEENFNPFLSNSSIVETSGINFSYYGQDKVYRITDKVKLLSNESNNYIFPKVLFIYNPRNQSYSMQTNNYSPYTCFKLGLRIPNDNYYDYNDLSLLGQFKRDRVIGSYEWFVEYDNKDDTAKLIIGTTPYEYNNKKYDESNYKPTKSVIRPNNNYYYWNIDFTQVYFVNENNKRVLLDSRIASLEPSSNVIKGPQEYSQKINETIFKQLIIEKKCFEESIKREGITIIFYCHNTDEVKNYIKSRFSNINFLDRFLGEEFTLTYNDLFLEKGDKLYFLVVFDLLNSLITWCLGKPFLKKYFFSYNYDKKILAYYGNNKNTGESGNQSNSQWGLIIIAISLIIIFCILGFLLAKYIYMNKKKKDATELDEDSQYQGIQPINEGERITN